MVDLQWTRFDGTVAQGQFEDHVAFYSAGKLVLDGNGSDIYDIDVLAATEQEVMGRPVGGTGSLGFFNPPFVAAVFAPLTLLSVEMAGVVLFAINVGLVLGVTTVLRRMLNLRGIVPGIFAMVVALSLNSVFWLMVARAALNAVGAWIPRLLLVPATRQAHALRPGPWRCF